MKKVNEDLFQSIESVFTKPSIVHIAKDDLGKFKEDSRSIYYSEYKADDENKAIRISERIKYDLVEFGSENKAALYITGDPGMDEVSEILDGLHGKAKEIIWGSCDESNLDVNVLKVALLFFIQDTK